MAVLEGELSWKAQVGFWLLHRLLDVQRVIQAWTYRELDRARLERERQAFRERYLELTQARRDAMKRSAS